MTAASAPVAPLFSRGGRGGFSRVSQEDVDAGCCFDDIEMQCPQEWRSAGVDEAWQQTKTTLGQARERVRPAAQWLTQRGEELLRSTAPSFQRLLEVDAGQEFRRTTSSGSDVRISSCVGRIVDRLGLENFIEEHGLSYLMEAEPSGFNPLYYAVYVLSVVVFAIGTYMYLWPSTSITRRLVGTLMFACGIFLLSNSDLIVTSFRLAYQVLRLRDNNERFNESLDNQASEIRRLHKAEKGLEELHRKFGGSIEQAVREVERLHEVGRSDVARMTKQLCRLYCDKDQDDVIEMGPEFDETLEVMSIVFNATVMDYAEREAMLREGIKGKAAIRRNGGIKRRTFEQAMECALLTNDVRKVPKAVRKIIDSNNIAPSASGGA